MVRISRRIAMVKGISVWLCGVGVAGMLSVCVSVGWAEEGGSSTALSSLSAQADPYSGSLNFSIPVQMPPGRGGMAPSVSVNYNSSTGSGDAGVGWSLNTGAISRVAKHGLFSYDERDHYVLLQNGSAQELVYDPQMEAYRALNEGAFIKAVYHNPYQAGSWTVYDRNGTEYKFGHSAGGRDELSGKTAKWYIEEAVDVYGNAVRYTYIDANRYRYPKEITYTYNEALGDTTPYARVVFNYEQKPAAEVPHVEYYNILFAQKRLNRLVDIEVYANDQLQRRYEFEYALSQTSSRSLLTSIKLVGADGVSELPPIRFTYNEVDVNAADVYELTTVNSGLFDVTGDNTWIRRHDPDNDCGHDNYGPVPPTATEDVVGHCAGFRWGPAQMVPTANGSFSHAVHKDDGYWYSTFVYVREDKLIKVPFINNDGNPGFWINGQYAQETGRQWSLKAGWNRIDYTNYHQHSDPSFNLNFALAHHVDIMNSSVISVPTYTADFNGDSRTDLARLDSVTGDVYVSLSIGDGFSAERLWRTEWPTDDQMMMADVTGDGMADGIVFHSSTGEWQVYPSTGDRFTDPRVWISGFGAGHKPSLGDFDGDGFVDAAYLFDDPNNDNKHSFVYARNNQGTSFDEQNVSVPKRIYGPMGAQNLPVHVGDFNGDGLQEMVVRQPSSNRFSGTHERGGLLAGSDTTFLSEPFSEVTWAQNPVTFTMDINRDGRSDVAAFERGTGQIHYMTAKFRGWSQEQTLGFTFDVRGEAVQFTAGDFNGDGLLDFMAYDPATDRSQIAYSKGGAVDILVASDNGFGGVSRYTYAPAQQVCAQTQLPYPIQVLTRIEQTDAYSGDTLATRYEFKNGIWDVDSREFRGFSEVSVYEAHEAKTKTVYATDAVFKGRILEQAVFNSDGDLFSRTTNTWSRQPIGPADYVYLANTVQCVYDGDTDARCSKQTFTYADPDHEGLLTDTVMGAADETGHFDTSQPIKWINTEYVHNTSVGLIGLPKASRVYDGQSTDQLMRLTEFAYDHGDFGDAPIRGALTKQRSWAGTGDAADDPLTTYDYDDYGNLIKTTEPKGHVDGAMPDQYTTEIVYDPDYNLFPIRTENALDYPIINTYYGVNGHAQVDGLFGQLRSTTDPNGVIGQRLYDAFGRVVITVGPNDSLSNPSALIEYGFGPEPIRYSYVKTESRVASGQSQTIPQVSFTDGFGRTICSKSPGANGQFIVSGQTEYNERGLPVKQYLNRFVNTDLLTVDAIDPSHPYVAVEYDDIGRPVKTIQPHAPSGTAFYASVAYDDWTTVMINENGHRQESVVDAFGRLVEKREYSGADGRGSPDVPQDLPYALYATTRYEYTITGELRRTIDAHNNSVQMSYDKIGRKIAMDDPDMGHWAYAYDVNGNLIWQKDAKGVETEFRYDRLNRLIRKFTPNGSLDVDYNYDQPFVTDHEKGRLTSIDYNDSDHIEFTYDAIGREMEAIKTINKAQFPVKRDYNALDQILNIEYPDGQTIHYDYNDAGQIKGIATDPVLFDQQSSLRDELWQTPAWLKWISSAMGQAFDCLMGVEAAYAQSSPATIISPTSGALLNQSETFEWTASSDATSYWLDVGITQGGWEIFDQQVSPGVTSLNVSGLPQDGSTVYVRINSKIDGVWEYTETSFVTHDSSGGGSSEGEGAGAAVIVSPNGGEQLAETETFTWSVSTEATSYWLDVGSSLGGADLFDQQVSPGVTSLNVSGLPQDGSTVYVRINSKIDGVWEYTETSFVTHDSSGGGSSGGEGAGAAVIVRPNGGERLAETETFTWSVSTEATSYWLDVGSSLGGADLFDQQVSPGVTSLNVSGLPQDGSTVYVRINSKIDGVWEYTETSFVTHDSSGGGSSGGGGAGAAVIVSPNGGERLAETETFAWSVSTEATSYWLDVGSSLGGADLFDQQVSPGVTSLNVSGLPQDGSTVYVRINSKIDGVWEYTETSFVTHDSSDNGADAVLIVKDVQYTAHGQISRVEYGNGVVTSYDYDDYRLWLNRKTTVRTSDNVKLQDLEYTYYPSGEIKDIIDHAYGKDQSFKYDEFNRLTEAIGYYENDGQTEVTKTYSFDEVGNLKTKDGYSYEYGDQAGPHAVTSRIKPGSPQESFTYDANGNMETKQVGQEVTFYTYDEENRLVKIERGNVNGPDTVIAAYEYDGDGGRTAKIVDGQRTDFVGKLYEESPSQSTLGIYLGSQRIAAITNGQIIYTLTNHLGSADVVTDRDGLILDRIEYEPWGKVIHRDGPDDPDLRVNRLYTGQYSDEESGLYFYGGRYYDPDLGRFITADSIVPYPEDPQSFNRYTYVRNNPIIFVDPTGHIFGAIFAAIANVIGALIEHVTIASIVKGALIGGAIGGTVAAATGGDIGQGILTGAISGAIFGGIGDLGGVNALNWGNTARTIAHGVGGAMSGTIGAAITGGDLVEGALIGGVSAGVTQYLGHNFGVLNAENNFAQAFAGRTIIGATLGGLASESTGGHFLDGAKNGAISSAIAFLANDFMHRRERSDTKKWIADQRRISRTERSILWWKFLNENFWIELSENPPAVGGSVTVFGMRTSVHTGGSTLGVTSTYGGVSLDIYSSIPTEGWSWGIGGKHLGVSIGQDLSVGIHIGLSEDVLSGRYGNVSYNYFKGN
jgi:RHS repeat-associated protein